VKYESLENVLMKELRLLRKTLVIVLIGFVFVTSVVLVSKNKIFIQAGSTVKTRPLLTYVCREAFLSVASAKPVNVYLTSEIQNALKKTDFKVDVDEVLLSQEVEENKCRLIVKGGERVRSFLINMVQSANYDFYYKLAEINETEVGELK